MDAAREIRRLKTSLGVLWLCAIAVLLWVGLQWAFARETSALRRVVIQRSGDHLDIEPMRDGPYIVFGIATTLGTSMDEKRWATLDRPIFIIDSEGAAQVDLKKLKWFDGQGNPATPPNTQALEALYLEPAKSEPHGP